MTFDFTYGLMKDNLLMVDRETGSLWSQLEGKAISGPLAGAPLEAIASLQTTWRHWRELHPDTRVMIVEGSQGSPYLYRNPLRDHAPLSKRHDTSALGLGLVLRGAPAYFPFWHLARGPLPLRTEVGGVPVVVRYREDDMTAWAEDENGRLLPGVLAYRPGWLRFFPDSKIYGAKGG